MNELKVFENSEFGQVRTIEKSGEPWFVAADVCRALEVDRTATRRLDEDEKDVYSTHTLGGKQEMSIVNEPGLYSLVLGSRKPEAKAFKRWITHEVIPAIRKTGGYIAGEKDMSEDELLARALEVAQRKISGLNSKVQALEEKAETDAPKVLFADSVASSKSEILVGDLAKILQQNGTPIGANRLFERLRNDGYLIRRNGTDRNMPSQKSVEMGLMRVKETAVTHADGHVTINRTPKITGKGQVYFVQKYTKKDA